MSAYSIAIVEDEQSPPTGAAVVRIGGLRTWPQGASVRILPIDEAAVPPMSEGWPWGDLTPERVVPTEAGVDVFLGPDVVNSPRLLPGTPITIKVPAAQVEADARWPAITATVRRRAGAVAMSAAQLLAARAERERAEKEAAARRQELAEFAAKSAREAAAEAQLPWETAKPAAMAPRGGDGSQLARLLPLRRAPAPAVDRPAGAAPATQQQLARLGATPTKSDVVPIAPPSKAASAVSRPGLLGGFALGSVVTAGLVAGLLLLAPPAWLPGRLSFPGGADGAPAQIAVDALQVVFKDLAATGPQSPRRKSAVNVDIATALSLADHSLRGQRTAAEAEEAEFWLKRALAQSFGGADVGWALTQLGTIYAQRGTPQHDYAKAHTVWQLAAAQGDPVAHCFLGALYENGLGVIANRKAALAHYEAADAAGACRSAKEAASRLKD